MRKCYLFLYFVGLKTFSHSPRRPYLYHTCHMYNVMGRKLTSRTKGSLCKMLNLTKMDWIPYKLILNSHSLSVNELNHVKVMVCLWFLKCIWYELIETRYFLQKYFQLYIRLNKNWYVVCITHWFLKKVETEMAWSNQL